MKMVRLEETENNNQKELALKTKTNSHCTHLKVHNDTNLMPCLSRLLLVSNLYFIISMTIFRALESIKTITVPSIALVY